MTRPKVIIASEVPKEVEDYIRSSCEVIKWDGQGEMPREKMFQYLQDVEGMILSKTVINRELLSYAPKLKVVANRAVGYNNFDIEAMREYKVWGTHTPEVLNETVADLGMALILCSARRIAELDRVVKEGQWQNFLGSDLFGIDVHHSVLGIIGLGRIGEEIAKRAKFGFDMEILYHNRRPNPKVEDKYGAKFCTMEELLQMSDFVLLMTPLTSETKKLMGPREFSLMKPTSIFINISRGGTVDEDALVQALESKTIRGAALDVYVQEPIDPDHPLLKMPHVVTVPHIGSAVYKTRFDMAMLAAKNLVAGVTGKKPLNIVSELSDLP